MSEQSMFAKDQVFYEQLSSLVSCDLQGVGALLSPSFLDLAPTRPIGRIVDGVHVSPYRMKVARQEVLR